MATSFDAEAISLAITHATNELGYRQLRPKQELAVKSFLGGSDVFVCLPTGSGKSLCYCLLPKVFDFLRHATAETSCIVVIVSPLIALMQDQVRAMTERKVNAVYGGKADDKLEADICSGKYQLVFFSPESLLVESRWRDMLRSPIYCERLVGLVVDEAHCVKKWGETFRAAFSQLGEVRSLIPETVNVMALTATATRDTRVAVCRKLGMVCPVIVSEVPNKPNIMYNVISHPGTLEDTFAPLVEEIRKYRTETNRVIIYCRTYEACSMIYMFLKSRLGAEMTEPCGAVDLSRFRLVDMFCACTTTSVKNAILQSFCSTNSKLRVVVATVAFGMGLDCPNVRRIIHWGPSSDVEQYLQETGRAGRDGLPAQAILYNIGLIGVTVEESMKLYYCGNKETCRRQLLLDYFDQLHDLSNIVQPSQNQCCDICCKNVL